jgi:multisubunit Na+/H+ antiporter MnhB subunit
VLVKVTPPLSVRMSQLFWILSFAVGGFTAIYFFVIRQEQLPLIADLVREVAEGRSDETYDTAADIVFWIVFGVMVGVLLVQITLLVSFMSRRPHIRWWQLATLGVQVILLLLSTEWVALGERRDSLLFLLAAQAGLVLIALLFSTLPKAIKWSARQHDIRRGHEGVVGNGDL